MELLTRWGRDIKEEGRVVGREEGKVLGLEEGKVLGREEGKELGARELLLSIGQSRLGPPSKSVISRISKIKDLKKLEDLAIAVFNSLSWKELLLSIK